MILSRILAHSRHARWLAWIVLIIGMLICRGGYLEDVIYNIDEAEYAVAADALDHGWLSGVDLIGSTKTPGIVFLYNLLFHIFGRSLAVIHVAHLVIMILTGVIVVELAAALWGIAAIVPSAVLFWMTANSFSMPDEILALNVESPGTLFAIAAGWLAWAHGKKRGALLASGVLLGIAVLFRQSFPVFVLPVGFAAFVALRWRGLWQLAVGVAAPWLVVFSIYGLHGGLGWALDSWIRYPLTYSSDVGFAGFFQALWRNSIEFSGQEFVPLILALLGLMLLWKVRTSHRALFVLLLIVASFLALASGSRFFGHYWIQVFPAIAVIGSAGWLWLAARSRNAQYLLIGLLVIGALLSVRRYPLFRDWSPWAPPKGMSPYTLSANQTELTLAEFAREHTNPDETIVVWGYCPQIYYHAHRLPGVRDYIVHYVTGFSPGSFYPNLERAYRPRSHPRAEEMFVEDLQIRRPKYIMDIAPIRDYEFPFTQYPLRSYPLIADHVLTYYLPDTMLDGAMIYRLKTADDHDAPPVNETLEQIR